MTKRILFIGCGLFLVGCSSQEENTSITTIEDTETKYAVVESKTNDSITISLEEEGRYEDFSITYEDNEIPVIKDSHTISLTELQQDDALCVTYYDGTIHAIQVIEDDSDTKEGQTESSNSNIVDPNPSANEESNEH